MEKSLDKSAIWTLKIHQPGVLSAEAGVYWLTREGDPEDYFLQAGQSLGLPAGRWLVQALAPGVLGWVGSFKRPLLVNRPWGVLTLQGSVR